MMCYSTNANTICQMVCKALNITETDREIFWGTYCACVKKVIKVARNDAVGAMKLAFFKGKLRGKLIVVHNLELSQFFFVDFVKAHIGGIKAVKKNLNLDQILEMRQLENAYFNFVEYFVSSVIGKTCFKQNSCDNLLSHYATISDEAFAILIFENNLDAWLDMGMRKDTSGSEVPRKYTNGGRSKQEVASSQQNKGWSEQGLKRFNELFDKVKENRNAPQAKEFEDNFKSYCEDKASSKKKRAKPLEQESFAVRHELFSNNEDDLVESIDNAEKPKKKKMKLSYNDAAGDLVASMDVSPTKNNFQFNKATETLSMNGNKKDVNDKDEDETEDEGEQPDSDGPVVVEV